MERNLSIRTNSFLLLGMIVLTSFSGKVFAIERRSQLLPGMDCVSCTPQQALGNPVEGNKSIKNFSAVAGLQDLSDEEYKMQSYTYVFCGVLTQITKEKEFKKEIILPMITAAEGGSIDKFWLGNHCETRYMASTKSPLAHVAAENSTDRLMFLVSLQKMYAEKNDLASFTNIINAKNTKGMTTLDYILFMVNSKSLIKDEEPGLNKFVKFLCDNGAVFAQNKKKCPVEYIKINGH